MRILAVLGFVLIVLPLGSCSYFWFSRYPTEVQRDSHGPYSVVAYAAPSSFLSPELVFGSIHNNTTIVVSLMRGDEPLSRGTLIIGGDLAEDHLPLAIAWSSGAVTIAERQAGKSITLVIPGDGT